MISIIFLREGPGYQWEMKQLYIQDMPLEDTSFNMQASEPLFPTSKTLANTSMRI